MELFIIQAYHTFTVGAHPDSLHQSTISAHLLVLSQQNAHAASQVSVRLWWVTLRKFHRSRPTVIEIILQHATM